MALNVKPYFATSLRNSIYCKILVMNQNVAKIVFQSPLLLGRTAFAYAEGLRVRGCRSDPWIWRLMGELRTYFYFITAIPCHRLCNIFSSTYSYADTMNTELIVRSIDRLIERLFDGDMDLCAS